MDVNKYTVKQLRDDFGYIDDNIEDYLVSEDELVNIVFAEMTSGKMNMKTFFLWCIRDIVTYAIDESSIEEDAEFIKTDKRARAIIRKYEIDVDLDDE